jgi:proton-dependent oligopeptide transporter, POT family
MRNAPPADPATRAADTKTLLRIAVLFSPITVFWALYDQTGSTWVQQGEKMTPLHLHWLLGYRLDAESIQSLNAILVLVLIPFCVKVLYPLLDRYFFKPTPLRRMGVGLVFAAVSFAIVAWLQQRVDSGEKLSIVWQILPYIVLTIGEVFLSATGLEFAFSKAPTRLKSTIMSFWLLTVFFGNLLAGVVAQLNQNYFRFSGSTKMFFYTVLMLGGAILFALIARKFPEDKKDISHN